MKVWSRSRLVWIGIGLEGLVVGFTIVALIIKVQAGYPASRLDLSLTRSMVCPVVPNTGTPNASVSQVTGHWDSASPAPSEISGRVIIDPNDGNPVVTVDGQA
jgi:hypothetical protein